MSEKVRITYAFTASVLLFSVLIPGPELFPLHDALYSGLGLFCALMSVMPAKDLS